MKGTMAMLLASATISLISDMGEPYNKREDATPNLKLDYDKLAKESKLYNQKNKLSKKQKAKQRKNG